MPQFFMSIAHHATTHKNFGLAPQIITTDAAVVSVWLQFIKTIDIIKQCQKEAQFLVGSLFQRIFLDRAINWP